MKLVKLAELIKLIKSYINFHYQKKESEKKRNRRIYLWIKVVFAGDFCVLYLLYFVVECSLGL